MKVLSLLREFEEKRTIREVLDEWSDLLSKLDVPEERKIVYLKTKDDVERSLSNVRWLKRNVDVRNGYERIGSEERINKDTVDGYYNTRKILSKFKQTNRELELKLIRMFQQFKRKERMPWGK